VEPGETLVSVATRYNTKVEVLRTLNKLSANDSAPLPSMLLRVPESDGAASPVAKLPGLSAEKAPATSSTATASVDNTRGSISRSVRYTVRQGDTIESIAAQYAQAGHSVSAQSIRDKNRLSGQPRAGSTLLVPVGGATYVASAQRSPQRPPAVQISEQFEWPVAEMTSTARPVYQSPNQTRLAQAERAPSRSGSPASRSGSPAKRRGPSNLAARGYFPNPSLDGGARVLKQDEEAPNAAPPRPRSRVVKAPQSQAQAAKKLARVAKVATNGARIRRLPDAQAVTLYACPTSTEIAVIKQSGPWSAILMSDRSTGWIPTRYLKFTSASVDISQIKINNGFENLRRTGPKGYAIAGNFSSNHPMVATALTWMGTPYVYGGESRRGVDCSALVQNSFASNGVRLPRTAAQQARVGRPVQPSQLQAGDRLYFSASGTRIDHTGLYMGDGLFVHASGTGRKVIVSNLYDRFNWNIFVGARR
jgi:cell wall-associated NlpC family hydrolase